MPKLDSPCMFCGNLPCTCEGVGKKKSPAKKAPKQKDTRPPVAPPVTDDDPFGSIPEPAKTKFKAPKQVERDLSFECALRNIRDIVSERDQRWIDNQLHHPYPQDVDRRIAQWKERHGSSQQAPQT